MSISAQLHSVARAEYLFVRTWVTAVDRRLVAPLEGRSTGLDSVLARVRGVFEDVDDRLSGTAHADEPAEATAPTAVRPPVVDTGSVVLSPDELDKVEELADDYLEAEADHLTGELADNDELRRVQAELRAKHTLQERDEQR